MQGIGHLIVNGEKIKVLWRTNKTTVRIKLRKTGKDGMYFEDESNYLVSAPVTLAKLCQGIVIRL